jgi:dTDP-4-dehydrorhamnose 3,5-epimerase
LNELKEEVRVAAPSELTLDDFVADRPLRRAPDGPRREPLHIPNLIDGVAVTSLVLNGDDRGSLCELLTTRDGPIEPIAHVYQVAAAPGSVRAWVYHRFQRDRLTFTTGDFEIALYDLRSDSPTWKTLNVFQAGERQPTFVSIPPFVAHGVKNIGAATGYFTNLPTKAWDPASPDKRRIHWDDPRIPHSFR